MSWLVFTDRDPFHGVNAGLVALAVNIAVVAAVSLARPARTPRERMAQPERLVRAYR